MPSKLHTWLYIHFTQFGLNQISCQISKKGEFKIGSVTLPLEQQWNRLLAFNIMIPPFPKHSLTNPNLLLLPPSCHTHTEDIFIKQRNSEDIK